MDYGNRNYRRNHRVIEKRKTLWPRVLGVSLFLIMLVTGIVWGMGILDDPKENLQVAVAQNNDAKQIEESSDISETSEDIKQDTNSGEEQPVNNQLPEYIQFGAQDYCIVVHKLSHTLELYKKGDIEPFRVYGCATAKNSGDKTRTGDNKTPVSWGDVLDSVKGAEPYTSSQEIPFVVEDIYYAGDWTHDFGDGKGEIAGAYGEWFISLNTGWDGIGIHGTHDPASIGTNASEGCIRLHNEDVNELKEIISQNNGGIGVNVIITED